MASYNSTRSATARGVVKRSTPSGNQQTAEPPPVQLVLTKPAHAKRPRLLTRVRAWMLVLPVDALLLMTPAIWAPQQIKASAVMALLTLFLVSARGRYRARLHLSVLDELPGLLGNLLTAAAIVATVTALRHDQNGVTTFLTNAAIAIAFVVAGRIVTVQLISLGRRSGITVHRTLLIGGGPLGAELQKILKAHTRYGLSVVGVIADGPLNVGAESAPWLGDLRSLDRTVVQTSADVLLVTDGSLSERALLEAVRTPACMLCDLLVVPRMPDFNTQIGQSSDHIGSIPIMRIRTPNLNGPARAIKRGFDIVVAGVLLLLVSPVLLLFALALRIEGGPDVIFRQARVGRNGKIFNCLKLRSMRPADVAESSTNWSIANDKRVSRIGRFLRRTSIDELPQLWNIIRGDMTLVGPRPERPHFVEEFSARYDRYNHRHRVRAGLTGLAQVSGLRGDTSIADRARFDNYYIENWSLWLDIKILLRTFSEVLFARGR